MAGHIGKIGDRHISVEVKREINEVFDRGQLVVISRGMEHQTVCVDHTNGITVQADEQGTCICRFNAISCKDAG
ncbi:MAG: hypothetical protein RR261_06365 [Oscillospiraceae bacterium]